LTKLQEFKEAKAPLPADYAAWQVFGAGFEKLGKDGRPVTVPLREPADNEILLRVDALGLCLSDIKIINQGSAHPRLRGRDLATDPTVLGHECAVTVVAIGKQWREKFAIGERYLVQADIYYKGIGYAFGYMIPGGMQQYTYLDERGLDGDEGCYLLPIQPETGYSEAALAEPWACVEMSYCLEERMAPGDGDRLVVVEDVAAAEATASWKAENGHAKAIARDLSNLGDEEADDIIVPSPTPELVTALVPKLRKNGRMFLLGKPAIEGTASIDVGRIHYDNLRILGGGADLKSIEAANQRHDLMPQGIGLFIGAGGPMGQMHVQRAIELPCGLRKVVVTDLDRSRLDHIENRFGEMAKAKKVELITLATTEFDSPHAMNDHIMSLSPSGYTDVCVLAPVPALLAQATRMAADDGLVNLFAGIPIGNPAGLALEDLCRGVKIIGSSGSRISDLKKVLDMVEAKELNTNMSVAAIGGLNVGREGLQAVKEARFPGKTVIYTQIPDLPLITLEDIPRQLPELADYLGPGGAWTKTAEAALLEMKL